MAIEFEAMLVKVVYPKGMQAEAKRLLREANQQLPEDFEIDEEYEGIESGKDFYGERIFVYDEQIVNQVKS